MGSGSSAGPTVRSPGFWPDAGARFPFLQAPPSSSLCEHWVGDSGEQASQRDLCGFLQAHLLASLSESVEMTGERSEDDGGSGVSVTDFQAATCGHAHRLLVLRQVPEEIEEHQRG